MLEGRLFGNRDFVLLWGGEMLSEVGSQSSTVAYPLLILALTGSATKAGVAGLSRWLPVTLFSLPAGVLVDALDRKRLMLACDAVRLLGAASVVITLLLGRPTYGQILLVAFVDGALAATSFICERGALRHFVASEQLHDAVASNEARSSAAGVVGPALGGALFGVARALPFVADASSYLFSMMAVASTRSSFQVADQIGHVAWRRVGRDIAEGFTWIRDRPFFRTASLLFAAGNPLGVGLYLLVILLAKREHASSAEVGAMLTVVSLCGLAGAGLSRQIRGRVTARVVLSIENWLMVGLLPLMLLAHHALVIGLLAGACGFLVPTANAIVAGTRISVAPDRLQGRIQAASTTISASLAWLGPLAVGFGFEHLEADTTIWIAAGWALCLSLVATFSPSLARAPAE